MKTYFVIYDMNDNYVCEIIKNYVISFPNH